MQGANWDTIRNLSRDFGEVAFNGGENALGIKDYELRANGIILTFVDGSEVTYTPKITRNANDGTVEPGGFQS